MHFKTYEEAQNFAESVIICQKAVKKVVRLARQRIAISRARGDGYNDSPFRMVTVGEDEKIDLVGIWIGRKRVDIPLPEIWLECYKRALRAFKKAYGEEAAASIYKRYNKGMRPVTVYTTEGISRSKWDRRRDLFMAIYMFFLGQENMVIVE